MRGFSTGCNMISDAMLEWFCRNGVAVAYSPDGDRVTSADLARELLAARRGATEYGELNDDLQRV